MGVKSTHQNSRTIVRNLPYRTAFAMLMVSNLGHWSQAFNQRSSQWSGTTGPTSTIFSDRKVSFSNAHRSQSHLLQMEPQLSTSAGKLDSEEQTQKDPMEASLGGIVLACFIILGLAINGFEAKEISAVSAEGRAQAVDQVAKVAVSNVVDAALPSSSTDLVAAAVGESFGGIIGAATTLTVTSFLKPFDDEHDTDTEHKIPSSQKPMITQAIADSDFFIANSASLPLLQAVGLPPGVASVGSVIFAAIPSQLVKIGAQRKQRLLEEEMELERLLAEEMEAERKKNWGNSFFGRITSIAGNKESVVNPTELVVVEQNEIDTVEIFCDVTRWLEYSALQSNLGATMTWNGMPMDGFVGGVVFGIIAAISSQLYADFLYGAVQFGPKQKRDNLMSRTVLGWISLYSSRALNSATLFGFYEFSQGPISRLIQGTLAGGVDGCVGSESFDACLQTYIDTNSPGPSPEAQLRALITNVAMVGQRIQDVAADTSAEEMKALVGAWYVSFLSWLSSLAFLP